MTPIPRVLAATRVLARDLSAPEGPTLAAGGWILNVNSVDVARRGDEHAARTARGGDITATNPDRPLETKVIHNTSTADVVGIPAALAFGPDQNLYVTDSGHRAIVCVDAQGCQTTVADSFRGARLNGPNDLTFDDNGDLYFSDPFGSSASNPTGAVYLRRWHSGELVRIDEGLAFPNGIVVRSGTVYLAETYTNSVWAYDVAGGCRHDKRLFCSLPRLDVAGIQGPDGMCFDADGLLYVTHVGSGMVYVFDQDGRPLECLAVPGTVPTNVCFGGPDRTRLYVTIDDTGTLVELDVGRAGDVLNFCPSRDAAHPWTLHEVA